MYFNHYCSECSNLNTKKEKKGKVSGALYECKKLKKTINPTCQACEKFNHAHRSSSEEEKIYKNGKDYYNDTTPLWVVMAAVIILLIIGLITGVFFQ